MAALTVVTFVTSASLSFPALAQSAHDSTFETRATPTSAAPSSSSAAEKTAIELEKVGQWLKRAYAQPAPESASAADGVAPANDAAGSTSPDPEPTTTPAAASTTAPPKSLAPPPPVAQTEDLPSASTATVTGQAISVPKGEATIQGMGESFSAQLSTGIATYSVPFSLPKARGDAQPSLGLSYSSSGGFGVAGVGWSAGVPFIARQTDRGTPQYQDDSTASAFDFNQDRFVFNGGQELVPICVVSSGATCAGAINFAQGTLQAELFPAWSPGWQYFRPRVEGSFLRFFWSPDHLTWRVQSKEGVSLEFGVPLDGSGSQEALEQNPAPPASGVPQVFRWMLVRQYDSLGNTDLATENPTPLNVVRYRYTNDGGTAYLTDIYDTPPSANTTTAPCSQWAHHTRLVYEDRPDPTTSYRSGFRIDQVSRLVRVDVASKPFAGSTSAARELVRRYELGYDPNFHVSMLASLTVEGRCASTGSAQLEEDGSESIPYPSGCPTLPPMTFGYSHVTGHVLSGGVASSTLPGYEPFDERVQSLASSPDYSLDSSQTALEDVNGDGLPDVLVTAPGFFGGKDGLYLNGGGGTAGQFLATTIGVHGVLDANANDITLGNPNVAPLDLDGDGIVNLVHMPLVQTYAVYSPALEGSQWWWEGRTVTTADQLNPKIDFGGDAVNIKVADVNDDGLVDVVRSTGTEMQTYFSLGRYPNGDGRFGSATRTGIGAATFVTDPVTACLPWSGTAVSLGDADTELADMNGDGLPDIVRLRRGDVRYWPGRGNGVWGTGARDDCPGDTFGQDREVQMDTAPYFSDIQGTSLRLEDVNGDGLPDLVQVRFQDVDIWLNVDGTGWTPVHTVDGTPASPSYADRVRLTDIDGSGTPDILWGNAGQYQYIDLAGGQRPGLLTSVANGLGKTTTLQYSTSAAEMLAAQKAGTPWTSTMPIVSQIVKQVTVSAGLTVAGASPEDVTQYTYSNPVYDGRQREFRGFGNASTRRVGDANSPADTTDTTFLLGQCVDETPSDGVDDCAPSQMWRDNPREALKGLAVITERRNDSGAYHSTAFTVYRLRQLYSGLDGRQVRHAFDEADQTQLYDVAGFQRTDATASQTVVNLETTPGSPVAAQSLTIPSRMSTGSATLRKEFTRDYYGNADDYSAVTDRGCISGSVCSAFTEKPLYQEHTSWFDELSKTDWMWRGALTAVWGGFANARKFQWLDHTFDAYGHEIHLKLSLPLPVELTRAVSDSSYYPTRSVSGTSITLLTRTRDSFGNVTREQGEDLRCTDITYDSLYAQFPITETRYSGSCGSGALETTATWDRGLGVVTEVHDVAGQPTLISYDGFGRLSALYRTDPASPGVESSTPSTTVVYTLPSATQPANSMIHTSTQTSGSPLETYAYVDGLGRTFATLREAEGGQSIADLSTYDAKAALQNKYLEYFTPASGAQFSFTQAPGAALRQSYDAFGRPADTVNYCNITTLHNLYHALATDRYDAEQSNPNSPHSGSYTTELRNGHGQVVQTTERFKTGSTSDSKVTLVQYAPFGAPETIQVKQASTGQIISRWLAHDNAGHIVINTEPDTSPNYTFQTHPNHTATDILQTDDAAVTAWRYRYDDQGNLVGVSDARGCGANYFYDGLGRLLMEDDFPCDSTAQAPYSTPVVPGSSLSGGALTNVPGPPTSGVEVAYEYDHLSSAPTPDGWTSGVSTGRLVRIRDRASHTLFQYDDRGRIVATAIRIAKPGPFADDVLATRYAPRWYIQTTTYDAADRPVTQSTGASLPDLLGAGGQSTVTAMYDARGAVQSVLTSYDPANGGAALVTHISRTPDDLLAEADYGDAAATSTAYTYDTCRELSEAMTVRAAAASWPTTGLDTYQLTLEDNTFAYDLVSNPVTITDNRVAEEWPSGAKPVQRTMTYDDFYRVTSVTSAYPNSAPDPWTSPFADENNAYTEAPEDPQSAIDSRRALPTAQVTFANRPQSQTYAYDWKGNTASTTDDATGFYDRSLGTVTNGTLTAGPYQMKSAAITTGTKSGTLSASYDIAGNMVQLNVDRNGPCTPTALCSQIYKYEYDELDRLTRARRWDLADVNTSPPPTVTDGTEAADLRYRYDNDDNRIIKWAHDPTSGHAVPDAYTLYVFSSLEERRAPYNTGGSGDYDISDLTEVPYLGVGGDNIARVVYEPNVPESSSAAQHVFYELGDHLGSTSTVLDKTTGELVEKATYAAYGATDSDYRPGRWGDFREDYRFTGKEDDVEVGLTYFGKRFYSANLNRWMNPDPLALHEPGKADLNLYAYVHGRVLSATDPMGLDPSDAPAVDAAISAETGGQYGTDASPAPPVTISTPEQMQGLEDKGFEPGSPTQVGSTIFFPRMTISADSDLVGRAWNNGLSPQGQAYLESTPGVPQTADFSGAAKGLASMIPGVNPDIKPTEQSGAAIGQSLGMALATIPVPELELTIAAGGLGTAAIQTPYALEVQSMSVEAQAAIAEVRGGATVFRAGQLGESMAGESQYWSLSHPLGPGYASQVGLPGVTPNFIMGGTVSPGAAVITNEAAALGANAGGGIQVVTSPGAATGLWFHMP